MKKRKLLSTFLVLTMAAGLTACGSGQGSDAPANSNAEAQADGSGAASGNSGEKKEVTVWAWDVEYNIPVMQEAAKRYEAKHPDVTINVMEYAYDDIVQKINTNLSSGITDGLPEIMLAEDANVQKNLQSYPGAFYDMTDLIDFSNFAEYKVKVLTLDGKVYGVPFDIGTEGFFYRKDYMEQIGYSPEDLQDITWDDYIEIGKKLKEETGKSMMTLDPNTMTIMRDFMQSSGTWYFNEDGSLNIVGNPVIEAGCKVYKGFMDAGIVKMTTGWGEMVSALNNGDVASIVSGCWIVPTIRAAEDQSGLWGVARMPRLNIEQGTNYGNRGGSNWLVLKEAPNADIAADFLNEVFANDSDFYSAILTDIGAIGAYKPAQDSAAYTEPVEFFGGAAIWSDFAEWAQSVPPISVGVYSDEVDTILITGMSEYVNGGVSLEDMLQSVSDQVAAQIQ